MPPHVALVVWLVMLIGLLRFDPAKEPRTSLALWVPTVWIFIIATRLPTQWLSAGGVGLTAASLEEGSPTDRLIFTLLIFLAFFILMRRSVNWGDLISRNLALTIFLVYALISVCWSELPFVAFKRWFRDLGNYLSVFIALSDVQPIMAVRILLRRLGYLLLPLSLLLCKYFPEMGMQYNQWTGTAMFVGAATSKNGLGTICLVCGLYFFWDLVARWEERKEKRTKKILFVDAAFLAMTFYVLHLANSQTSHLCLIIGCLVILIAHSKFGRSHAGLVKFGIPSFIFLYLFLNFVLGVDINAVVARAVGRDPNLTERTLIWPILLDAHTNSLVGTGYESFWVGSTLNWVWAHKETQGLNEAHNGYLEVYLNLGLIGLSLLTCFLLASYRKICQRLKPFSSFATLGLAVWTIALFYDITEAAFKSHLMWVTLLLVGVSVRPRRERNAQHQSGESTYDVSGGVAA